MTTNTAADARAVVTQADREAAVDIAAAWVMSDRLHGGDVRAGKHDDDPVVQIAARHRLAAEQQRIPPSDGEVLERLRIMAKQKLPGEMDDESIDGADWQGAYEWFCTESRAIYAAIRALIPIAPDGVEGPKLDDDGYLWKWVERGLFDPAVSANEALGVIASHPAAPWQRVRWDVDHKPYAATFYKAFPKAALSGIHRETGKP